MKRPSLKTPDPDQTELNQALRYSQNALVMFVYLVMAIAATVLACLLVWYGSIWVWHHLGYALMSVFTLSVMVFLMWGE